jgi:outer membrane protein TolC
VEALFKHGAVAKNEVLRVQVDVSNAELLQIQSENAVNVAWRGLSRAVGIALPEKAALPEPEKRLEGVEFPPTPNGWRWRAVRRCAPSISCAKRARKRDGGGGTKQTSIFFEGKYQDVGDGFYPDKKDQWTLSLVAQWTLYDHGEVRSQAKKGRSMVREFLGRMDDLEKQVIHEVATARLNLESALKRTDVARTQVILAEEDYRMALQRYVCRREPTSTFWMRG